LTPGRKDVYNRTHQFSYVRLCGSLPGDVGLRIFTGRETEKQENAALRNMPVTLIRRTFVTVTPVMALLTFAISAQAGSLVLNGDFENVTNGSGGMGEFGSSTYSTVANWTSHAYNFVFAAGTADTTGSNGINGNLKLWGPNDGSANGLPAASPTGGNFVAADAFFDVGAITQTINGLVPGDVYLLSFYWAGAQQSGFNGDNTEQWQVSLGSQAQSTAVIDNPSHGFTPWMSQTFAYTATSSSELLSFLAVGPPTGFPPFLLLDGVSLDPAPESASVLLMIGGLCLTVVAVGAKRRFHP